MKMAPTHFTNHMKYAQQNSKKQKWHNAAYWGSFQNDRQITGNMKKKNPRNENGTNPFHNAAYWGIIHNDRKIKVTYKSANIHKCHIQMSQRSHLEDSTPLDC